MAAILVGLGVFFISAAFQSGNNIGVAAAFKAFVAEKSTIAGVEVEAKYIVVGLLVLFNLLAISFLFVFKDMYKMLERAMSVFVGLMLLCFAVNLICLQPDPVAMAKGFVPSLGKSGQMLPVLGLVGTTFVITAAFYQAYLVRQKGWGAKDLASGLVDARIGSVIMFLITMMLMSTAAAGLYQGGAEVKLADPIAVADSLETTFGPSAKIIFCLGLFSAAYSSFLVNSMIGGFMAADGLGLGSKPTDLGPRVMTTAALLTGMTVGVAVEFLGFNATPTIIAAQAVTVVAAPLVAGVLLWLTSSRDVMGAHVNKPATMIFGIVGLVMLIAMAGKTAFFDLPKKIDEYRNPPVKTTDEPSEETPAATIESAEPAIDSTTANE